MPKDKVKTEKKHHHEAMQPEPLAEEAKQPGQEVVGEKVAENEVLMPVPREEKSENRLAIGTLNVFMPEAETPAPRPVVRSFLFIALTILGISAALLLGLAVAFLIWGGGIPPSVVPPFAAAVSFPERIVNYEPFQGKLVVKNTGKEILDNGTVNPKWPSVFMFIESEPQLLDNTWIIPPLNPGEEFVILWEGKVIASQEEHALFSFELFEQGKGAPFQTLEQKIISRASGFFIEALLNGKQEIIANLGDALMYNLHFENRSNEEVRDVRFNVELQGALFDLASFHGPQARLNGSLVSASSSTLPLLSSIPPDGEGDLAFSINILPYVPPFLRVSADPPVLKNKLTANYVQGKQERAFTGETTVKVNSEISLLAQARYFSPEGEQVGRGPLPPEVGSKTTYWIYFRIGNILNTLGNGVLTLSLADEDVGWTGRASTSLGSDFLYDPFTKQASWVIGTIPANRSYTLMPPSASFEISVVPEAKKRGDIPLLLKGMTLSGKDTFTGTLIEKKFPPLDADLRFDERGKAMGYKVK